MDLEDTTILDDVDRVDANHHLLDFKDSFIFKKRNVSNTVADAFELATELFSLEVFAGSDPLTELVSIKSALVTAQGEDVKAQDPPALLQLKHDTLHIDLHMVFTMVHL